MFGIVEVAGYDVGASVHVRVFWPVCMGLVLGGGELGMC